MHLSNNKSARKQRNVTTNVTLKYFFFFFFFFFFFLFLKRDDMKPQPCYSVTLLAFDLLIR